MCLKSKDSRALKPDAQEVNILRQMYKFQTWHGNWKMRKAKLGWSSGYLYSVLELGVVHISHIRFHTVLMAATSPAQLDVSFQGHVGWGWNDYLRFPLKRHIRPLWKQKVKDSLKQNFLFKRKTKGMYILLGDLIFNFYTIKKNMDNHKDYMMSYNFVPTN